VLFTRGTSGWINRVNQNHKRLVDLGLSPEQRARLDKWTETEFVYSTLRLEDANLEREHVAKVVAHSMDPVYLAKTEPAIATLLRSLWTVTSFARSNGKGAQLTLEFLQKLDSSGAGFRRSAGDTSRTPTPVAPEHLPALLEGACRWYTAESFGELNPVEQASIVLLRLIDMQPFELGNEPTALVAASLFTLRSDLPPIIIQPEMHSAYRNALDEGTRMNTNPMVETLAGAIERSLVESIEEVRQHA